VARSVELVESRWVNIKPEGRDASGDRTERCRDCGGALALVATRSQRAKVLLGRMSFGRRAIVAASQSPSVGSGCCRCLSIARRTRQSTTTDRSLEAGQQPIRPAATQRAVAAINQAQPCGMAWAVADRRGTRGRRLTEQQPFIDEERRGRCPSNGLKLSCEAPPQRPRSDNEGQAEPASQRRPCQDSASGASSDPTLS
jgi:hypothetical protein